MQQATKILHRGKQKVKKTLLFSPEHLFLVTSAAQRAEDRYLKHLKVRQVGLWLLFPVLIRFTAELLLLPPICICSVSTS